MPWFYLFIAGCLEVGWVALLRQSSTGHNALSLVLAGVCLIGSVAFLAIAIRDIPLGPAYALWTSMGIIGAFAIGVMVDGEPITLIRGVCAALILIGAVGLKLSVGVTD